MTLEIASYKQKQGVLRTDLLALCFLMQIMCFFFLFGGELFLNAFYSGVYRTPLGKRLESTKTLGNDDAAAFLGHFQQ